MFIGGRPTCGVASFFWGGREGGGEVKAASKNICLYRWCVVNLLFRLMI
jgi:hypothetical protein